MMHEIKKTKTKKTSCDLLLRENADSIALSYLGELDLLVVVKYTVWQHKQSPRNLKYVYIQTKIKAIHLTFFLVFFFPYEVSYL